MTSLLCLCCQWLMCAPLCLPWVCVWSAGNIFVVSLAVADLVVAIYPYPLVLTSIFHNGWNLGYAHCQISGFLMGVSVIGSIFNITGIAINRYCYICHSLKYDKLYSDKNSVCYVMLIWALTVVAIVPNLFVGSLQYDPRVYSCTFEQSASSAYTIAVVFFHFILPIMIVTYCYLRIWILVIQVRRRVKPDNRPKITPHDVRNFVTMFVVFVLFAVCWAPLNFIGLAVAIKPEVVIPLIPEWLFVSSYFMAYFNSCLNAIVYGVLNQNFRREYKRIVVSVCTARIFFQDSSNDAGERLKSKPSPLMTNNNQVKVDSVWTRTQRISEQTWKDMLWLRVKKKKKERKKRKKSWVRKNTKYKYEAACILWAVHRLTYGAIWPLNNHSKNRGAYYLCLLSSTFVCSTCSTVNIWCPFCFHVYSDYINVSCII